MKFTKIIIMICISVTLLITVGCGDSSKKENENKIEKLKESTEADVTDISLYFVSEDSKKLDSEKRIVDGNEILARTILDELIQGPERTSKLKGVFPKDTKVSGVSIKDGTTYVTFDFSTFKPNLSPDEERMAVKSLVYTLVQVPGIEQVKINVNPKSDKFINVINIDRPLKLVDFNEEVNKKP